MNFLLNAATVLVVICAFLLILMVIAQSNRGSDLGLFGGSAEMVFGSQQMNALSKITMMLAFIVISGVFFIGLAKSYIQKSHNIDDEKQVKGKVISDLKSKSLDKEKKK